MSKKTICVLDDEILAATSIRDLLNDLGFRVLPYFRADTFIDELPNLDVDLLITDYYLNDGAKGIGLCRAIRNSERHARVPILIISGADDPALRAECLAAGASAFLGKPLFLSDLREAIAKLIGPIQEHADPSVDAIRKETKILHQWKHEPASVVSLRLKGFTKFSEEASPDQIMDILSLYFDALSKTASAHAGVPCPPSGHQCDVVLPASTRWSCHQEAASAFALAARSSLESHRTKIQSLGYGLDVGIGMADGLVTSGYASLGQTRHFVALGSAFSISGYLCSLAQGGQILASTRFYSRVPSARTRNLGQFRVTGTDCLVSVNSIEDGGLSLAG